MNHPPTKIQIITWRRTNMCLFFQPGLKFHQLKTMAIRLRRNKSPRFSCGSILDHVCAIPVYTYIDTMTIILYSTYTMLVLNPHLVVNTSSFSWKLVWEKWWSSMAHFCSSRSSAQLGKYPWKITEDPWPFFPSVFMFSCKAGRWRWALAFFPDCRFGDKISGGTINQINLSSIWLSCLISNFQKINNIFRSKTLRLKDSKDSKSKTRGYTRDSSFWSANFPHMQIISFERCWSSVS